MHQGTGEGQTLLEPQRQIPGGIVENGFEVKFLNRPSDAIPLMGPFQPVGAAEKTQVALY